MIKLRIDRKKVDRTAVYKAPSGAEYYDFTLFKNREGPDKYDYDGFAVQDLGQARREAGEKGPIIGNWRDTERKKPESAPAPAAAPELPDADGDDIPF